MLDEIKQKIEDEITRLTDELNVELSARIKTAIEHGDLRENAEYKAAELPHLPPPISPARGPPQGDFLFDQTPAFDPAEAQPAPAFVFDQFLPDYLDD